MKKGNYATLIYLLVILLLSLMPRLWKLEQHPPLIVDEAANLRDIDKILNSGNYNVLDFHWDFSKSQLVYFPALLVTNILGRQDSFLALRLTSSLFSILALIPFFFIVKSLTNRSISFTTTLLLSFSYYYLQFSRVGWNDIIGVSCLGLYLIWFIQIASRKKSFLWAGASGVVAAIIFNAYRSGIIIILVSPFYLFYLLKNHKVSKEFFVKIMSCFLIVFFLLSLPWAIKISKNWEKYNLRLRVVALKSVNIPYHGLTKKSEIYKYQILTSIKSWVFLDAAGGEREENPRYLPLKVPPVNTFVRIGFLIGLVVSIIRPRKTSIWLSIYILGIFFGQILTLDPPNGARGLIILPSIYIFFALGLYKIYTASGKNKLVLTLLVIVSLLYCYLDFSYYQDWMGWIKV